jgi:hypothetical protein
MTGRLYEAGGTPEQRLLVYRNETFRPRNRAEKEAYIGTLGVPQPLEVRWQSVSGGEAALCQLPSGQAVPTGTSTTRLQLVERQDQAPHTFDITTIYMESQRSLDVVRLAIRGTRRTVAYNSGTEQVGPEVELTDSQPFQRLYAELHYANSSRRDRSYFIPPPTD